MVQASYDIDKPLPELDEMEKLFVEFLPTNFKHPGAAYREAGGDAKDALAAAHRLMKKPQVAAALHDSVKHLLELGGETSAHVVKQIQDVAFGDITDAVEWENGRVSVKNSKDLSQSQKNAIMQVKQTRDGIEVKMHPKMDALKTLAQMSGLSVEQEKNTTTTNNTIMLTNIGVGTEGLDVPRMVMESARASRNKVAENLAREAQNGNGT